MITAGLHVSCLGLVLGVVFGHSLAYAGSCPEKEEHDGRAQPEAAVEFEAVYEAPKQASEPADPRPHRALRIATEAGLGVASSAIALGILGGIDPETTTPIVPLLIAGTISMATVGSIYLGGWLLDGTGSFWWTLAAVQSVNVTGLLITVASETVPGVAGGLLWAGLMLGAGILAYEVTDKGPSPKDVAKIMPMAAPVEGGGLFGLVGRF